MSIKFDFFSKHFLLPGAILTMANISHSSLPHVNSSSIPDIFSFEEHDKPLNVPTPKLLKILSIDGGGIRGIIPAIFLQRLEELVEKPIAHSFEIMSGTSTGGILTLGLNVGNTEKIPLYSASQMVNIYTDHGSEIFKQTFLHKLKSCNGYATPKYTSDGLEKITSKLLGDAKLSESITNTIIPAFEIERYKPYFFKKTLACSDRNRDFLMRDVIKATSAAPTYLPPARIYSLTGKRFSFIDGGVVLNNPTISATIHGKNLYPNVLPNRFMVISLGTGAAKRSIPYESVKNSGGLDWVGKIIPLMMDGASNVVDYQMSHVLPDIEGVKNYFRFQTDIPSDLSDMDNTHPENIRRLKEIGEKCAYQFFDEALQFIAKNIVDNRKYSFSTGDDSKYLRSSSSATVFLNNEINNNNDYSPIPRYKPILRKNDNNILIESVERIDRNGIQVVTQYDQKIPPYSSFSPVKKININHRNNRHDQQDEEDSDSQDTDSSSEFSNNEINNNNDFSHISQHKSIHKKNEDDIIIEDLEKFDMDGVPLVTRYDQKVPPYSSSFTTRNFNLNLNNDNNGKDQQAEEDSDN